MFYRFPKVLEENFDKMDNESPEKTKQRTFKVEIVEKWCAHLHNLRTFARNFSNIDFFLKILPLKDDELAMSEM